MPKSWDIDEYKDIESINFWKKSKELYGNNPKKLAEQRKILEKKARDHARTPMQWNGGTNAGFCESGVQPWMRVNGKSFSDLSSFLRLLLSQQDTLEEQIAGFSTSCPP